MTKDQLKILHKITEEITLALHEQAQEERYPSHSPDVVDDRIAAYKKRAGDLRRIRCELEDIFAKAG